MDGYLLGNILMESRDKRQEGKGKKISIGVVYAHLVWERENGVMDVSENGGLFNLSVCCIHVSIFDVVPAQSIVNTPLKARQSTTHLIVSLKSTVSCGTTPMACLRLAWL